MKPFLLLATRTDDLVADNEYESFLNFAGLDEERLRRIRLEQRSLGNIDLDDWSGIIIGGSPFNASDPEESKSRVQRRVETDLRKLLDEVVVSDFPFLGTCYGVGVLGIHQGAEVSGLFAEQTGVIQVTLTHEGRRDALMGSLPSTFEAFAGHKEAITTLPAGAVLLASSPTCPVQAFRIGSNVYAMQFHPELDAFSLCLRIDAYKYAGYFDPEDADNIKKLACDSNVIYPSAIVRCFAERYALLS